MRILLFCGKFFGANDSEREFAVESGKERGYNPHCKVFIRRKGRSRGAEEQVESPGRKQSKMNKILHNSILHVNVEQLRRNVRTLLAELNGKQLIPVLKGNAYGLGLERIGRELAAFDEIQTLAVAQVSEGAALREAGVGKDILVLGGVPERLLAPGAELDLTLPVWRLGVLPRLAQLGRTLGRPVKVQVKVETGLHRVGLMPGAELDALLKEWQAHRSWVTVTGAYSHFADLGDRGRTEEQYRTYLAGVKQLEENGMVIPLRHISASAASEYFPEYRLDGVRIGRRLYMDHPTEPMGTIGEVASWRTWVTSLRALKAGEPLGYGGHVRMERDGTVATIAVGYGDGLDPELVRAKGPVLIRGKRVPMLACCMDQTLVDVTGLDCRVDDEVTLYGYDRAGNFLSAQEVSLLIGDNEGCGLTSLLSGRVARVYEESLE